MIADANQRIKVDCLYLRSDCIQHNVFTPENTKDFLQPISEQRCILQQRGSHIFIPADFPVKQLNAQLLLKPIKIKYKQAISIKVHASTSVIFFSYFPIMAHSQLSRELSFLMKLISKMGKTFS